MKISHAIPGTVIKGSQTDWKVYTHALDRDALLITSGTDKRPDLQLIAMMKDAGRALLPFGISLQQKVLINGFSASGTFANRFTSLHPDLIAAVACGGINAMPVLPVRTVGNASLHYPTGTHDIKKLTGAEPIFEVYKEVLIIICCQK